MCRCNPDKCKRCEPQREDPQEDTRKDSDGQEQ